MIFSEVAMDPIYELAQLIDHSLLHPTLTDAELEAGCELARKYRTASVCIKPYAVRQAAEWLGDSGVLVGTVIGFPHGNSTINIKVAETVQACKDGAAEIDMVVNVGKVLGEDWKYAGREISSILHACRNHQAILKVIFENDYLPEDRYKIHLCEICREAGVDYVKTSTGYGFVKNPEGLYSYSGATEHDLKLMLHHAGPKVKVKAAGGVRTLDDLLHVKELGVSRVGASATAAILEDAKVRYGTGNPERAEDDQKGY
jgi:deoxyribose-phosphate aldolase